MSSPFSQTHDFDFENLAQRYDLCNHLFSAGIDRRWRRNTVKILNPQPGEQVLDLCCGSGDLAFALVEHSAASTIIGLDRSSAMIKQAVKKYQHRLKKQPALAHRLRWETADALQTALPSAAFDIITCAFGLRNIPDRLAALREMKRLLKPNGRIGILEFSLPPSSILRKWYWMYLRYGMPAAGLLLFRSRRPLLYLAESIRLWEGFPLPATCRQAGLLYDAACPMSGGIVTLHLIKNNSEEPPANASSSLHKNTDPLP
jgi:demethylmenaquinone methyltransferase/2-methoxy-6-polyprenyl-1,4-benzoquinol methylase